MGMNPRTKKRPLQPTQLTERASRFINPLAQKETISLTKRFFSDSSEQNWYGLQHLQSYTDLGGDAGYNNKTYKESKLSSDSYLYDSVSRNSWKMCVLIGSKKPLSSCQHRNNPIHHPPCLLPSNFPFISTISIPSLTCKCPLPSHPPNSKYQSWWKGGRQKALSCLCRVVPYLRLDAYHTEVQQADCLRAAASLCSPSGP